MMSRMGFGDTQTNAERSYDICHAIVRHLSCNRVTYVKQSPKPTFSSFSAVVLYSFLYAFI